jgi:hypothetical protein
MRQLSKRVFGQADRLGVALFIARQGDAPFSLTDVVLHLGLPHASSAQAPLAALLEAGFIVRTDPIPGSRFRYYQRVESVYWDLAEELAARISAPSEDIVATVTRLPAKRARNVGE